MPLGVENLEKVPALSSDLLSGVAALFSAEVRATETGVVAGLEFIREALQASAAECRIAVSNGDTVEAGSALVKLKGTASELAIAEDLVMGPLGFASGVATTAKMFKDACPDGLSIACGGWKKLPLALKPLLRSGLAAAGVLPRLVEGDFIYVNKNAVQMLGGVAPAVDAGRALNHGPVAIQVKNCEEAEFALAAGAGIIMVDTAKLQDLDAVHQFLVQAGKRQDITLAFGGGVSFEDLLPARELGADAVDVGRAILNAPLLDLRLQVIV